MDILKVENLGYSFTSRGKGKIPVLEDVNIEIKKGDFVVILGESGCGKTTFLNLLAGIYKAGRGAVYVNDSKITEPHFSRSFIFQQPTLLPWLTVKENITFGCNIRGETRWLNRRLAEYIELIGLVGSENLYPHSLSQGMAQRVAIARSLIGNPEILLLDEPFTALDYYNKSRLQGELIKLWKKLNFTTVFVTHDIEEALIVGQKIIILGERPAKVVQTIDIDSPYPRNIYDEKLSSIKLEIQTLFKNLYNSARR